LADIHLSPGTASESNLRRVVEDMNSGNTDFVILAGDISNVGSDEEFMAIKNILDDLKKPLYLLPGNHETNWSESGGLTFNKLWGDDRFFFSRDGFTFVGYNTGPFMKMGDGFVKQEDVLWLERKIKTSVPEGNILISFSHYPLIEGLSNWPEVTGILNSYGCRLALCGHGHRLSLHNFNGIPGVMCRAMVAGDTRSPGYNIINISNDSVYVFDKIPGFALTDPALKFSYSNSDAIAGLNVSLIPDYKVNDEFPGRYITGKWDDSSSILSGPCLIDDTLLVYGNSTGNVRAFSTRSGEVLWQTRIAGPVYSTPVTTGGVVVLGTVEGEIIGLKASTGSLLWKVAVSRPVMSEGITEGNFVYIGGGDRSFCKINAETGKVVWQFTGIEGLIQGKPVISDASVLFGAWDTYFYCLDKNSGALIWKWSNGKSQKLYSPGNIYPVCSNGKVFIVAPDRYMTALDIATGREIWRSGRHQVRESLGISSDGEMVFAKLMNDTVIAVSAREDFFRTLWKVNAGFGYEHSPCPLAYDDNKVIATTRNGFLIAIDAETGNIIWKYKAGNSIVNKIITDSKHNCWFTLASGRVMGIK
jgi:outer membrane protein assembly factor BamB/predicted phosphohydrolase